MLLDRFREAKAEEIALLTDMASRRELPRPWKGRRPDFLKAIAEPPDGQPVAVIAPTQVPSLRMASGRVASGCVGSQNRNHRTLTLRMCRLPM